MDENVSALYALLLVKTQNDTIGWSLVDGGSALIAKVGSQTVKVSGFNSTSNRHPWGNSLASYAANNFERQPTIVVYDSKLNVVASGGVNGQPTLNAFAATRQSDIENISSPRLLELADLLATKHGKRSSVQQLVETLKAS